MNTDEAITQIVSSARHHAGDDKSFDNIKRTFGTAVKHIQKTHNAKLTDNDINKAWRTMYFHTHNLHNIPH